MEKIGDKGGKTLGRRTRHPTQTRGTRLHPGKASPTQAHMCGDNGRQWETRGGNTSGRRTHHPTQAHMSGDKGRERETRGDKTSGRRTHHPTQAHMWGDKGTQDVGKADTQDKTSGKRTNHPTQAHMREDNGRQWEPWEGGRAIQRQREKRTREGRHTSQQREARRETKRNKTSETRTHHPTKGNKKGHNVRQDLRNAETPSNTGTHVGSQ